MAQSIMEYNGSAIVAMTGKECVAIAADRRLGVQAQTVSTNFQKMFQMSPKVIIGLPGLATDVITVYVDFMSTSYVAILVQFCVCACCASLFSCN